MVKISHAQTVLTVEDIEALKKKTGENNTKDAIATAVSHYLECEHTDIDNGIGQDPWARKVNAAIEKKLQKEQAQKQDK